MLCAPVFIFIYIWQLSSYRASRLWFMRKWTKHENMNGKWLPMLTRHAKHKQDYYLSTILFQLLQSMNYSFFVGFIHVSLWHLSERKELVSNNSSPCHMCSSSQRGQYWPYMQVSRISVMFSHTWGSRVLRWAFNADPTTALTWTTASNALWNTWGSGDAYNINRDSINSWL